MTFWPSFIIGCIVTFLICLGLHSLDVDRIEANNAATLAAQIKSDNDKCNADKEITSNASTKYENQISSLNSELERVRNATPAIVYVTRQASRPNATAPKQPGSSVANAINSQPLISESNDCETDRLKTIGLQEFINAVWANNGQQ
jgi:hypothetical protein